MQKYNGKRVKSKKIEKKLSMLNKTKSKKEKEKKFARLAMNEGWQFKVTFK